MSFAFQSHLLLHTFLCYTSLLSVQARNMVALCMGWGSGLTPTPWKVYTCPYPILMASSRCQFVVIELLLAKFAVDQNTFCCVKPSQKHLEGTRIRGRKKWMYFNGLLTVWFIKSQKKSKGYGFKRVQLLSAANSSG